MARLGFKRCSKNEQPTLAIENSLFVQRFPSDPDFQYIAKMNGVTMKIRINDFPAEALYTLIAAEVAQESLDDWPSNWVRPKKT